MDVTIFFFDTYAFCEIMAMNPSYREYAKHKNIATSLMNIYEFHYALLEQVPRNLVDRAIQHLQHLCIPITQQDIITASSFRFMNKKSKFSYIDSLGYIMAQRRGMLFLTGDNAFLGMNGVEFIR